MNNESTRPLSSVVTELKDELKAFLQTRCQMLAAELKDKLAAWKMALPSLLAGLLLLLTAWLLLTGALVAAILVAFAGNPFAAAIALAIVGVGYLIFGGVAMVFALRSMKENGLIPQRTVKVLKEDQIWIQREAKIQT